MVGGTFVMKHFFTQTLATIILLLEMVGESKLRRQGVDLDRHSSELE